MHLTVYQNLRSNCTYVITNCVHVRNLHPGANLHPDANLLHRICTTYKGCRFAPGCIFIKHRLHDQNTPQVQIYTPGVYLHRGVYCAYERGFNFFFSGEGHAREPLYSNSAVIAWSLQSTIEQNSVPSC